MTAGRIYVRALLAALLLLIGLAAWVSRADAAPDAPVVAAAKVHSVKVRIPQASALYQLQLEREAASRFGLEAPVALIAAQIHAESTWRITAQSPYAQGLAQFTPPTARWLPEVCPEVGAPDPWDANWSIRAIVCYDAWLHARNAAGRDNCERWAFALSSYNGGEVMLRREQRLAEKGKADPTRWFENTERFRARAKWAWDENRTYVVRILKVLEPAYRGAGWPGSATC